LGGKATIAGSDRGEVSMRRLIASMVGLTVILALAALPATAGTPGADVSVTSATADVASASQGDTIVFRAVVQDLGPLPVPDSLDVHFEKAVHISVTDVSCRAPGEGEIVSNDGNYCEFGAASVGERFIQRVTATVTGSVGNAKLTFCASTENSSPADPNPTNDCRTVVVPITT
jgi:Domain of unknown function DUF11